ncbi:hypothetical protein [Desulfovibrio inopinatus]|uniref:hypothetical protein n=1 Tax=Desulfovibrio inopinatus TaxID=102109 RepID=UPI0004035815|nr:hypothetical protein [Desulfovibrio inopinatus]
MKKARILVITGLLGLLALPVHAGSQLTPMNGSMSITPTKATTVAAIQTTAPKSPDAAAVAAVTKTVPKAAKTQDKPKLVAAITPPKSAYTSSSSKGDAKLSAIEKEFYAYAQNWLQKSAQLGVGTKKSDMQVTKIGDKFVASYQEIEFNSLRTEVKKKNYDHTPYVGHMCYKVLTHKSIADTKQAALNGPFVAQEHSMREIFGYDGKKKAWR